MLCPKALYHPHPPSGAPPFSPQLQGGLREPVWSQPSPFPEFGSTCAKCPGRFCCVDKVQASVPREIFLLRLQPRRAGAGG